MDKRFQSPSLRGSGRFAAALAVWRAAAEGFNPLHCGAVVASGPRPPSAEWRTGFQSPSLRGSGRFVRGDGPVIIRRAGFNPLHCGAVVASDGAVRAGRMDGAGFNPLHCGAVVASKRHNNQIEALARKFQSPSLRGSGRFEKKNGESVRHHRGFQSPSLRGSGRFACAPPPPASWRGVSIPFIAGQWSLLVQPEVVRLQPDEFQSPSLRGSGRFPSFRRSAHPGRD